MKKKIIGYQLKDASKEDIVRNIIRDPHEVYKWNLDLEKQGYPMSLPVNCMSFKLLNSLGIIEKLFTPIYENDKSKLKVGDYIVANYRLGNVERRGRVAKIMDIYSSFSVYQYLDGVNESNGSSFEGCRLATVEEILQGYLDEADRRYPKGTKFKSLVDKDYTRKVNEQLFITYTKSEQSPFKLESLNIGDGSYVMYKGKWAEIVEDKYYPDLEIDGYVPEFRRDTVKFGCQILTKEFVGRLDGLLSNTDLTLYSGSGDELNEKVKQIYLILNKQ